MTNRNERLRKTWAIHIDTWKKSGLTQAAYCNKHDLKPHQFWYWNRRLKTDNKPKKKSSRAGFVSVQFKPEKAKTALKLRFPNGMELDGIQPENLAVTREIIGWLK